MVFVTLGTGVGGGIVVEGNLLHGAHGSGAEIGHMVLNRDETDRCNCGKYVCVEQYCSATGIVRMAKKALEGYTGITKLRRAEPLTCKDIFDCGKAGDELALQVLDQVYNYMGEFLANICNVVDPDAVVLGGGVSRAGQVLLDGTRPYFDKYVFHAARGARFELASLGNDAGAYGAFKLALDAFGK
jgi:glucokinase